MKCRNCKNESELNKASCRNCMTRDAEYSKRRRSVEKFDVDVDLSVDDVLKWAHKPNATISGLCSKSNCTEADIDKMIVDNNLAVKKSGDWIGIRSGSETSDISVVEQICSEITTIGAISDLHCGSKYCMRSQIKDFVNIAYSRGVRQILGSGDILDGCYRHGRWELSHHGLTDQTRDAIDTLPVLSGLSYHMICGNHDQTFTDTCGVEVGPFIESAFAKAGRNDMKIYGNMGAYIKIGGALVHLWHPKAGAAYALSYPLQKRIESYSGGQKPDILLCGHLHKYVQIASRGIHAFLVPCFQSGGSAFSNSLVGPPANGGLILSWRQTTHGTIRSLTSELISYYNEERPREIG